MGEVLSQNEIDSLLQALSTGELDVDEMKSAPEKSVKNYDFKRPAKFSKEHLRTLEIIFEHYGRLLSTNIGFAILDRMLGGAGKPLEKNREFSEIELSILDKIMVTCMQLLREPWKNVVDLDPFMERIETNAQFAQIIAPNEMIAIVTLNIKIGDVEGYMNACLPYITLEDIMDKLNTKFWFSTMQNASGENYAEYISSMIKRTDIPVKAVLGKSVVSVMDFAGLQVGDVIRLDSKIDDEMEVYVGNIKKFTALPGTSKDNYAVRITSVVREEE